MIKIKKSGLFLSSSWPCFLIICVVIWFLTKGDYDESSGIGSIFVIILIPIIYFLFFVISLIILFIDSLFANYSIDFFVRLLFSLFMAIFLFHISDGYSSKNYYLHLFYSFLVSSLVFYPMRFIERRANL